MTAPTLPPELREHLPRASALVMAARSDNPDVSPESLMRGMTAPQLRNMAVLLATFVDTASLLGETFEDPLDPLDHAISACARRFGVPLDALSSPDRRQEAVEARQVAAYITHKLFGISSPIVGKALNRDHSTVLFACTRVGENARLRRISHDIAERIGWQRPGTELLEPEVAAS